MAFHVQHRHSEFCRLREGDAEGDKFRASYDISTNERDAVKQRLASDSSRKRRRGGAKVVVRPTRRAEQQRERGSGKESDDGRELSSDQEEKESETSSSEEEQEESDRSSSEEEEEEEEDTTSDSDEGMQGSPLNEGGSRHAVQRDSGEIQDSTQGERGEAESMEAATPPPPTRSRSGRTQLAKRRFSLEG